MEKMNNAVKVLVMHVIDYSITDEATGRRNEGCSIQYYFFGNNGEALAIQNVGTSGMMGYQRGKCSTDIAIRKKFSSLPAICDAEFTLTIDGNGKAVQKIIDVDNVVPVDFSRLVAPVPAKAATASAAAK